MREPIPFKTCQTIVVAVLIILAVGALVAAGIGSANIGANAGWWPAGSLPQLDPMIAYPLTIAAVLAVIGLSVACVKYYQVSSSNAKKTSRAAISHATKQREPTPKPPAPAVEKREEPKKSPQLEVPKPVTPHSPSEAPQTGVIVPSGLYNLGNSCYMNAALQALFYLAPLRSLITQQKAKNNLIKAFAEALEKRNWDTLIQLRSKIFETGTSFVGLTSQQDAHELLMLLFGVLEWKPMVAHSEIAYDLPLIGKKSHNSPSEDYNHLTIDIVSGRTLQQLVDGYFASESIKNTKALEVEYEKDTYKVPEYSKTHYLEKPPELLMIHLKRFTSTRQKFNVSIPFPQEGTIRMGLHTYSLVAMINHLGGSIHSGHYTAHIKDLSQDDQPWIHCNDHSVALAPPSSPETDAYVLFLQRID